MSTKHNCKHPDRNRSNYGKRLAKRGLTKAPGLTPVESLRKIQERREEQTGVPWWTGKDDSGATAEGEAEDWPTAEKRLLNEIFRALPVFPATKEMRPNRYAFTVSRAGRA